MLCQLPVVMSYYRELVSIDIHAEVCNELQGHAMLLGLTSCAGKRLFRTCRHRISLLSRR